MREYRPPWLLSRQPNGESALDVRRTQRLLSLACAGTSKRGPKASNIGPEAGSTASAIIDSGSTSELKSVFMREAGGTCGGMILCR